MSLPLRYQFALALVGVNIIGTAALAGFAYRASRNSLEDQATRAVGVVAEARDQALVQLLQRRQERMDAFLGSVESLCGERAATEKFGWERECVRVALSGFQTAERASAADLRYGGRRLATRGTWPQPSEFTTTERLATISGSADHRDYTMQAARGRLTLRVRFPLDDIDAIFQDRSGLESNGEALLTDRQGRPLTLARYPIEHGRVLGAPLEACLGGAVGQALAPDYHGTEVISGFRPVPAVGGGCVVANLQYAEALVPIQRLGRLYILASITFILAGAVISLIVARAATRPIARLAASARELEAGQFGHPVPVAGPSEVRQLGRALSRMAQSLGDLVHREHDARVVAESANRTKDDFLAMVSHELRTPLNAILGWSSIMLNHRGDEAMAARAFRAVDRSARTQARLIDELLDVSRIVSGQLRLNIASQVSVIAVVEMALEGIRPSAHARHVAIVTRFAAVPPIVAGDVGRLQQIVGNLLSNAVRFTPAGGRIEVAVDTVADAVEIRVADTGIGISAEFLPHVFERFQQADSGTARAHGGLGLGLAIVHQLAELHGGSVRAESAGPGCGATFIVRLPQAVVTFAPARGLEPSEEPSVPPLLEGTRVVVVDDDPETTRVLRAILEDAGASVTVVTAAPETRAIHEHAKADLLIADIGMPREDGYSLIRSVRALESDESGPVPAIALTAHARPEDVEEALASGFQMHLSKPVDSARLLSAVTKTLVRTWTN
jgi:signal transduction histidine kinase/CheY-like chemotaxis protein